MAELLQHALSLAPVPGLSAAFALFRFIYGSVEQIQASRHQLKALTTCAAQLLSTLNIQYQSGRLVDSQTRGPLDELNKYAFVLDSMEILTH